MRTRRVAVVGGGVSGLVAAYCLAEARRAGVPLEEYVFEASPRLGGALRTEQVEGCLVEAGADSFLTEKTEAARLCREIGLGDRLIGSRDEQRRTWIVHRGRLAPLPEGFEFMVPTRLGPLARTPLLSLGDKFASACELFYRKPPPPGDESVAQFIRRHFGRGVLETIVDPLLAGVYGGDPEQMSAQAILPRFVAMERDGGSLIRQLQRAAQERKLAGSSGPRPPIFTTLRDGLETLARALGEKTDASRIFPNSPVAALERIAEHPEGGYRLRLAGRGPFEADAVILGVPGHAAGRLLRPLDEPLAQRLAEIPYSSSLIVALGYERSAAKKLPPGFGFLVPRKERPRLLACTFVGQKFPHRVPENRVLLRCFLGGVRDEAALELCDADAVQTVKKDLQEVLGLAPEPLFWRVYRWPQALAQYTVGHRERLARIRERAGKLPRVHLCGGAYEGIGVPDCIVSGRKAAQDCLRALQASI